MSDYLSGVVSRALNIEPEVRPVVPSIFEPGAAAEVVETQPAPAARPAVREQRMEMPSVKAETAPAAVAAEGHAVAMPEPDVPWKTQIERHTEVTVTPAVAITELRREVVEHATVIERHNRELHESEVRELFVETVAPPGASVKLDTPEAKPAGPVLAEQPAPAGALTPAIRPAPLQAIAEPVREETAVRVTIGRVEVRAVFPAAAAASQAKPSAAAVMPLEEYLRHGNRRGR